MKLLPVTLPEGFSTESVRLDDRVVLVTGATGDVGLALCPALARCGATVILAGRKVPRLEKLFDQIESGGGPEPAIYPIDLAGATASDYEELVTNIGEQLNRLDGVIHLACAFDGLTPLAQIPADQWMTGVQTNLNAVFLLNQSLLPLLLDSDGGRIITTLDNGEQTRQAYWGAYGVTKAALEALTVIAADELEAGPIEVNAVQPGPLRGNHRGKFHMGEDPTPMQDPSSVVPAYLYLMSSAREPLNGRVICAG